MLTKTLISRPILRYYNLVDRVETWKFVFIKNSLGDANDRPFLVTMFKSGITLL